MPTRTPARTIGEEAARLASSGIKVFPLWNARNGVCLCSDREACASPGKHPRIPRGVTDASSDAATIAQWWARWPDANLGLPAGSNGLAILDVDPAHGGELSFNKLATWALERHDVDLGDTRIIRTGSGGLHLYYRQPPGGIKTATNPFGAPGLDTRGRGGYVVAPPSIHACGERYETLSNLPAAPWPDILTKLMTPRPAAAAPTPAPVIPITGGRGRRWAAAALKAECEHLAGLPHSEGNGKNQQLNTSAYKMGQRIAGGFIDEPTVIAALHAAASNWPGHGERELRATIASGIAAGKKNPHPGPTTGGASPGGAR